jgi:beta-galactosidase
MIRLKPTILLCCLATVALTATPAATAAARHTFTLGNEDFLLDGKPFQIRCGEIHPERIPQEYWRHRLKMVKAAGLNTVACYIFWNAHESEEGKFDFTTGNLATGEFLRLAKEEGLFVMFRPGPYVCSEWDLGGLPPYLLANPDADLRHFKDKKYLAAAERYFTELAKVLKPHLVTNGGNVITVQLENEYGSFSDDRPYLEWLRTVWRKLGVDVPFTTSDGPLKSMLTGGTLPGCAVGLDSGSKLEDWALARKHNPGVPVFSGESYPGWLTHWGEKWAHRGAEGCVEHLDFLLKNNKSFNWYVMHGGTSFGFNAGANNGGPGKYQPDVTSYDFDAPINEQGRATPKYDALRKRMQEQFPEEKFSEVPAPIPTMEIGPISLKTWASVWNNLPAEPIRMKVPKPFEYLGQYHQGLMLYRVKLDSFRPGKLDFGKTGVRDFALVYLDGNYVGKIDRRLGETSVAIPQSANPEPTVDILVEATGHINFGQPLAEDRKGILGAVTLEGSPVENWEVFPLPLDEKFLAALKPGESGNKTATFFRAGFKLDKTADTYFDMSKYKKGVVWVNGHNLGRHWEIGPQTRLFCPASWLKTGENDILILDLLLEEPATVEGRHTLR